MGVTGLWTVVQPCARPVKIETLNKKRLAIDASIWIYQFLKAVRDKEGNALRNSHVVGFFRRICKLLFYGIHPVFVFDGGAPALKRQTIAARKSRREGRRDDATRTAGKLLALQMQRRAEEEESKRREASRREPAPAERVAEEVPDNPVYVEELFQTPQERQQARKFKKTDQYHLPELDMSLAEMGGPNDPRVMSLEELQEYARQFTTGEDINVYDFSKIDFDSPFFVSLPASDRYNILNAARLRSRLRMGYSKDQLDTMFPDRMAFSKFQIERVTERNELTQRLMNINNGMGDDNLPGVNGVGRVSGEKGREYVLVKNDGVEGGWALGVVTNNDEGEREKPISVDTLPKPIDDEPDDAMEEDDFEDVPIEGLNRLPKQRRPSPRGQPTREPLGSHRAVRKPEKSQNDTRKPATHTTADDPDSLFMSDEADTWEDVPMSDQNDQAEQGENEDEDLQRAIAMSLEKERSDAGSDNDDFAEVFHQDRVDEPMPFTKGSGLAIAHVANNRSAKAAPLAADNSDSDDDGFNLQNALAESRQSKRQPPRKPRPTEVPALEKQQFGAVRPSQDRPSATAPKASGFDGPLPFEKLDLGTSLLGKKKMQELEEKNAGGFEKPEEKSKKKDAAPLPPWFTAEMRKEAAEKKANEGQTLEKADDPDGQFLFEGRPTLKIRDSREVIDIDASAPATQEVITVESDDEKEVLSTVKSPPEDPSLRMGDLADSVRAEPPVLANVQPPLAPSPRPTENETNVDDEPFDWEESDYEKEKAEPAAASRELPSEEGQKSASPELEDVTSTQPAADSTSPEFKDVADTQPTAKSASPEFEDVGMAEPPKTPESLPGEPVEDDEVLPAPGLADQHAPLEGEADGSETYSDMEEDEELMAQLADEAEEHARFTASLNQASAQQRAFDYDRELKSLRSQQKKDRRDADEVTQTMISECQHLLALFGLPYVTAPMEAEAQCAELVSLGLVDGIVTDDSDIFLFGGTRVYKNMFNQAKFVECYLAADLAREFGLTRDKLVAAAQLLGSDYTPGLPGVGPVTAVELLSEFGDLGAFAAWWNGVQASAAPLAPADRARPVRRRFRRAQATKLFLPAAFPDPRVRDAYLAPDTDRDPQPFRWGRPDLDALRRFLSATVGWSEARTDEVLVPVVRDMNRREAEGTQSNITRYFEGGVGAGAFAPRRREEVGARLGKALGGMRERARREEAGMPEEDGVIDGEDVAPPAGRTEKRTTGKRGKRAAAKERTGQTSDDDADGDDADYAAPPKKARKKSAKGSATKGKKARAGA